MKEALIKKFIDALNAGYQVNIPTITLTRPTKEEAEAAHQEKTEEIFTPLQPALAVLYYQQLLDYFYNHDATRKYDALRQSIVESSTTQAFDEIIFYLFEKHYWNNTNRLFLVAGEETQNRLEQIDKIKYALKLVEADRQLIQKKLNRFRDLVYSFPPSFFKEKTEQLIETLQDYFDEYIAHSVKSGISIPIGVRQYLAIKRAAGKDFLIRASRALEVYESEFFSASMGQMQEEKMVFCLQWIQCLRAFLNLIRQLIFLCSQASTDFFKAKHKTSMRKHAQDFMKTCKSVIEKPRMLKY